MVKYDDREWWVDYAKTIGIFLVVFIHLIQVNFSNIFGTEKSILLFGTVFFMPLFFFVSGYLYKDIKPKTALKKYFKRLVVPYIFFTLVGIVIFILYKKLYTTPDILISTTGNFLICMFLTEPYSTLTMANGTIWFLIALFNVIIIFSLLKTYLKEDKHILTAIIGLNVSLYVLHIWKFNLYFFIDSALLGIMFFFTGYLSKKHNLINYFKNDYANIALAVMFFAVAYLIYIYNGVLGLRSAGWNGNFIISYMGAFSGILMVIAISSVLAKFKNKIIYLISITTLTIMGLEQFIRMYAVHFFKEWGIKDVYPLFNIFVITIFVLLLSVLIALFLDKHAPVLIGNRSKLKEGKFQRVYMRIKNRWRNRLDS